MLAPQSSGWNIFARELDVILTKRKLRWGYLHTCGIVSHTQKLDRLKKSLTSYEQMPTLNPEEMEHLVEHLREKGTPLTDIEQKRLSAALLAAAVEDTLLDRVQPEIALMIAEDVFRVLFTAMKNNPTMLMATGVRGGTMTDEAITTEDKTFTQALKKIDRATLVLHTSKNADSPQARSTHAQEALNLYMQAQDLLQQTQIPPHTHDDWLCWSDEAQKGCRMAKSLL